MDLVSSITETRARAPNQSYRLFVLRKALTSPLAIVLFTLSLVSAVAALLIITSSFPGSFVPPLAALSGLCLNNGKRFALQKAGIGDISSKDRFTLYLRAFVDDKAKVLHDSMLSRIFITNKLWNDLRFVRFEEVLARTVWAFGKLLALLPPGDILPESGAVRIEAKQGEWQSVIHARIRQAANILMTMGSTKGLMWEFQQLSGSPEIRKLSIITLPDPPETKQLLWRHLFSDSPQLLSCPEEVVAQSLSVTFANGEDVPIILMAQRPSQIAYRLALNISFFSTNLLSAVVRKYGRYHSHAGALATDVCPLPLIIHQPELAERKFLTGFSHSPAMIFNRKAFLFVIIAIVSVEISWFYSPALDSRCFLLVGDAALSNNEYNIAINLFQKALNLRPDLPEAHFALAVAFSKQGRLDEAIYEYHKVIALEPDFPRAHLNLAEALFREGRNLEGRAEYEKAVALNEPYIP